MGLRSVPDVPARPECRVDISRFAGEGAFAEFREPGLSDFMIDGKAASRLQIDFPQFNATVVRQILTLGRCYIRQADDPKDLEPSREMARIAAHNMGAFLLMLNAFSEAFPQDFNAYIDAANNDSTE